jgi:exonuclease III
MRGGGVGIYIRKGINYKIRNDLDLFQQKSFEGISIELIYSKKSYIISNIYHSPNPPKNTSLQSHSNDFLEHLDNHLTAICSSNKDAFIFLDSNIDLLKLNSSELANEYMNGLLGSGFIQLVCKATRIQNQHYSLIDHILTNTNQQNYVCGTLLSDISDHF